MKTGIRVKSIRNHQSRYGTPTKVVTLERYEPYVECKNECGNKRKEGSAFCLKCSKKYLKANKK